MALVSTRDRYQAVNYNSPTGAIPDDGSVEWYLHFIMGAKFKPVDAQEIMKRKRMEMSEKAQ